MPAVTEHPALLEIARLRALLPSLRQQSGMPAIDAIASSYAGLADVDPLTGLLELMRIVNSLPNLVADLPPGGSQAVAQNVIRRIGLLFEPAGLAREMNQWSQRNAGHIDFIDGALAIFDDLRYDTDKFMLAQPDLYSEIEGMKAAFAQSDTLSDASKVVLRAQLDLLSKCVHRFQTSGVGPFRDSAFSIYGRIRIQLESDQKLSPVEKKEFIDRLLRWYGVAEAGGSLLQLGGTMIAGLLTGPTAS